MPLLGVFIHTLAITMAKILLREKRYSSESTVDHLTNVCSTAIDKGEDNLDSSSTKPLKVASKGKGIKT